MAWDTVALLRLYLDDPDSSAAPFFTDDQLDDLLSLAGGDAHTAAAEGWGMKAANVTRWYSVQLDGGLLSRQQVFDHCLKMQEFHSNLGTSEIVSVLMNGGDLGSDTSSEF